MHAADDGRETNNGSYDRRFCVYAITNAVNAKIYIGITGRTLKRRFEHHLFRARHGWKTRLYAAIRKYGDERFSIEPVLYATSWGELQTLERMVIAERDAMNPNVGYNMTACGEGNLQWTPSAEWRARQSRLQSKRMHSPESRAKASASLSGPGNPRFGVTVTSETRRRISAALVGKSYPAFSERHRRGIADAVRATRRDPDQPSARVISFRGERRVMSEWAEVLGISRATLDRRLRVYGWSIDDAFTRPTRSRRTVTISNDEELRYVS
jgi:group I intron endonuclease